jgi:hypothetical protein
MEQFYTNYQDVPWYRRSGIVSAFTILGCFCFPTIAFVCILCLTGDIYYNKAGKDGHLMRWSGWSKVAAVIILAAQLAYIVIRLAAPQGPVRY